MSVLETTIGHVAEALVVAAAQHIEDALIVRAVGSKAELMARAGQMHAAGLEELASSLLKRVEGMDAQKPLASVIPMTNGAVEMVRLPASEVVEAAARYLAVVSPNSQAAQLWEKINYLVDDPIPDGKLKKKLRGQHDLYRLRVGDYRIFYTFGDSWVRLLGIRRRDNRTYDDNVRGIALDKPVAPPDTTDDDLDDLVAQETRPIEFRFNANPQLTPLPRKLTADWLDLLNIPPAYFPALVPCKTEEELLAANLPGPILERLLDNLFPRSIKEVAEQPDLVVQDTRDLVRYKDGDLITFLLKLDEDQRALTSWALKGPTMVKGGAGTGKSTGRNAFRATRRWRARRLHKLLHDAGSPDDAPQDVWIDVPRRVVDLAVPHEEDGDGLGGRLVLVIGAAEGPVNQTDSYDDQGNDEPLRTDGSRHGSPPLCGSPRV
jgi:mRNA-degrading endonuclease RelE of RelBE toxin-antitoxin system